jgi:hypothetical protein
MSAKNKSPVDTPALSRKYKCDINRIIRSWKKGKTDMEISKVMGIDVIKVFQIRQEIAAIHERERQRRKGETKI